MAIINFCNFLEQGHIFPMNFIISSIIVVLSFPIVIQIVLITLLKKVISFGMLHSIIQARPMLLHVIECLPFLNLILEKGFDMLVFMGSVCGEIHPQGL